MIHRSPPGRIFDTGCSYSLASTRHSRHPGRAGSARLAKVFRRVGGRVGVTEGGVVAIPGSGNAASDVDAPEGRGEVRTSSPESRPAVPWAVLLVTGGLILAVAIVKTAVTQILFADGAEYLTRIASAGGFYFHAHRLIAEWVMELPAVVAVWGFHVHSYAVLAVLLGVGYYVFPAILCIWATFLARKDILVFTYTIISSALLFCLSGGDGEVAFGQALFILGSTVLLIPRRLRTRELLVVTLVSLFAINSYQGFAIWAPVLAVLLFVRERHVTRRSPTPFVIANYLLLALATGDSVWAIAFTHSEKGANSLLAHALNLHYYPHAVRIEILVTFLLIVGIAVLSVVGTIRAVPVALRLLAICAVIALSLSPFVWNETVGPIDTYYIRGDTAGVIALVAGVTFLVSRKALARRLRPITPSVLAVGLLLFSLATTAVVASQWHDFQSQFSRENQLSGSYPVTGLGIQPKLLQRFVWPWNNPLLGVILATREGHVGVTNVAPPQNLGGFVNAVAYYAKHPSISNLPLSVRSFHW